MNIFLRSLIAAGALTLLGAAYFNKSPSTPDNNLVVGNNVFGMAAAQAADTATTNASPPSQALLSIGRVPTSGAGKPLFLGDAALTPRASDVVQRIAREPDTFDVKVMKADAGVVSPNTPQIGLDLGPHRVNLVQERTERNPDGSLTWIGHVKETTKARPRIAQETPHDALNSAILVSRDTGITGSIRMDGKLFRIRPIPDGGHAVIEVDESRRPPDHPDRMLQAQLASQRGTAADTAGTGTAAAGAVAAADGGPVATIRVMVVATDEAVAAYAGDMQALVDLAVAETNQGYVNSGIDIKMELAGYYTTNYVESGNWSTDLGRFQKKADGYLDNFQATRDAIYADVNVLLINDSSSCGLGYLNASADYAFSVVHYGCATGYYSFAHEIGHNQGADHNPETSTNLDFAYGHGYRSPNNAWRTVMAYDCTPSCPRVNYWSNPNVTYGGVAMGTADKSDNHRVLNETRTKVAAFRQEPVANVAPVANFSSSADLLTVVFTDSSTDSDGVIAARSWNFGDGTAASAATNPSHTYAAAGTYNVSLTVTDDDGATHTVTKPITIKTAETYSNATDYAINDGYRTYSSIVVSGRTGNAPSNTLVAVDIVHSYRGDLKIELIAPDGSVYLLKNVNSSDSADNVKTTYSVNLSSEARNGTWRLRVGDYYEGDTGYINSWSITF